MLRVFAAIVVLAWCWKVFRNWQTSAEKQAPAAFAVDLTLPVIVTLLFFVALILRRVVPRRTP
jgi:hypothetical protein